MCINCTCHGLAEGERGMIKDSTNKTILNVIEDIRALKEDVNGITRQDLEDMEKRLLEGLKEEHNGKTIVKSNGR